MIVDPTPVPVEVNSLPNDATFEIGGQYCVTCTSEASVPGGSRAIFNLSASNYGTLPNATLVNPIPLKVIHA